MQLETTEGNDMIDKTTETETAESMCNRLLCAAAWLDEAAEIIAEWGAYVPDYFQNKHGLAEDIALVKKHAELVRTKAGA